MIEIANENHVIMVDDNEGDVFLVKQCFLDSKLDNPWKSFPTGAEFLRYLKDVSRGAAPMPALVLLDLNMPGLDGLDVLERTRRDPEFAELPIFCMLTSSWDPRDKARAETLGASGFVTKSDNPRDYVAFFDSLQ